MKKEDKKNKEFQQKFEAEIALLESELTRFKVRGMGFTTEAKDRHDEHVEALAEKIDALNDKPGEFEKIGDHLWEDLQNDVENSWRGLERTLCR